MLRYLKIAPMLDPGLSALVAALGLYLREGNSIEELSSEVGMNETCYFTFDMKKLDPHPTPTHPTMISVADTQT